MATGLSDRELLARLVALDTTSGRPNLDLVDLVCDLVDRPGVTIERVASDDGQRVDLVAAAGPDPGPGRSGLVLSGHTDVVPAGDGWTTDPFGLVEADGRLVGRGACDMKGFLAIATNAFAAVDPGSLDHPLALVFTYDEEIGTLGARRLAERWAEPERLPGRGIVGEPTGLDVVRMHKGHLRARVVFAGVAAHSAYPALGRSAIEPAARAVGALARLADELAAERPAEAEAFAPVPHATLNVGRIAGGTAHNVVPDRCVIELGLRLLPGMDRDAVVDRIRSAVAGVDADGAVVEIVNETPPMRLPADAGFVREMAALAGGAGPAAVAFATDAGWLAALGIECVVCGPGSIEVAHRPDEWIDAAELARGRDLVERAIDRWCRAA